MSAVGSGEESGFVKRTDSLLEPIIRNLGIGGGIRLAQIQSRWHVLFREPLPKHMSPSSLSGDELSITVDSHVWLQELKFFHREIIKKLAPYQIKTVRFRLGRVDPVGRRDQERPKGKTLAEHDRLFIEDTVSKIEDSELRAALQKTIAKAMTAGKVM